MPNDEFRVPNGRMGEVRRWVLNIAAVALCITAIGLWVQSEQASWQYKLSFETRTADGLPADWGWHVWSEHGVLHISPMYSFYEWKIAYWKVIVLTSVPWLWKTYGGFKQARRRMESGLICRVCGYDLRATPDRCPECGTVPSLPSII